MAHEWDTGWTGEAKYGDYDGSGADCGGDEAWDVNGCMWVTKADVFDGTAPKRCGAETGTWRPNDDGATLGPSPYWGTATDTRTVTCTWRGQSG